MIRISLLALVTLATGCFDSLLGSPCKPGYTTEDGQCVLDHGVLPPDSMTVNPPDGRIDPVNPDADPMGPDGGGPDATPPDAPPDAPPDVPPDGPTCTADTQTDPQNCGVCGHACASGICAAGLCAGETRGHIIAIGHDYANTNAPMLRVLGNAAALGTSSELAVARWTTPSTAVTAALASGLAMVGRTMHTVAAPTTPSLTAFDGIDVLVLDPHTAADTAAEIAKGVAWKPSLDAFLTRGGVVIVLEGANGTNFRFADGADLFHTAAPTVVTGAHLYVVAGADAVAQQVLSPYFAAATTVAFPTLPPVVSAPAQGTVVFHEARP